MFSCYTEKMRASRLLSILILLQTRGRVSAEALAAEFEVSVRTIYRDVDQLSAAGVPVYAERGRNGGFALAEGYRTKLTGMTASEAEALAFAGLPAAAGALGLGEALAAAQLKLFAALPEDAGHSAARVAARFHVDPVDWFRRAEPLDALPAIAGALWGGKKVRVRYESWKGVTERTLSPFGLVLKGGQWYLVAEDDLKKGPRTFRVGSIRSFAVLEKDASAPPKGFRLEAYWREASRDFETGLMKATATLRVSEQGFKSLWRLGAHVGEAAEKSRRKDEKRGWTRVEIPIESVEQAARDLRRLGPEAEVLEPEPLRARLKDEAEKVARLYE
jgi:predicted DNA-binding transcriptional regulator YafY